MLVACLTFATIQPEVVRGLRPLDACNLGQVDPFWSTPSREVFNPLLTDSLVA